MREEIVLKSYEQLSATGWEVVLENVKERVRGKIAGNALYINKIKDYYQQASSKATVKRIQRTANQYVQKSLCPPHDHQIALTSHTESRSETIRQRKTRYSYRHTYFTVTSPEGLFRNNDYITLFIITTTLNLITMLASY